MVKGNRPPRALLSSPLAICRGKVGLRMDQLLISSRTLLDCRLVDRSVLPTGVPEYQILPAEVAMTTALELASRVENDFHIWLITPASAAPATHGHRLSNDELRRVLFEAPKHTPIFGAQFWKSIKHLPRDSVEFVLSDVDCFSIPVEHLAQTVPYLRQEEIHLLSSPLRPHDLSAPIEFFSGFAHFVKGMPIEEVDELVWGYLMVPCWYSSVVHEIWAEESRLAPLIDSMVYPFSDYLANLRPEEAGNQNGFFMWFDILSPLNPAPTPKCLIRSLEQILALDSLACQWAALHGINHLPEQEIRETLIRPYLKKNANDADIIGFATMCMEGNYL